MPVDGAKWALKTLYEMGFKIVVFSCKARRDRPLVDRKSGVRLIKEWLKSWGLLKYVDEITSEKPPCILLIDDNAYRFDNWINVMKFVKTLAFLPKSAYKGFEKLKKIEKDMADMRKHNEKIRRKYKING